MQFQVFKPKHIIAVAVVGAALIGGLAVASIMRPQTFATRWDSNQTALTKMQDRMPQATIDALHNRALDILHDMEAHAVAKDDEPECTAEKKSAAQGLDLQMTTTLLVAAAFIVAAIVLASLKDMSPR